MLPPCQEHLLHFIFGSYYVINGFTVSEPWRIEAVQAL
jgi:hypothetical protein